MNAGSKKREDSGVPDARDDKTASVEAAANGRGTPGGQAGKESTSGAQPEPGSAASASNAVAQGTPNQSKGKASGSSKNKISNVVTKFSFATKGGIAAHNPYKTNQDAYITSPHIMGLKHCHFFSVCDGHG